MSRRARERNQPPPWESDADDAPPIDWDAVAERPVQQEERTEE